MGRVGNISSSILPGKEKLTLSPGPRISWPICMMMRITRYSTPCWWCLTRTVLDKQLRKALEDFERTPGVVAVITGDGGAKSGELAEALSAGKVRAAMRKMRLLAGSFDRLLAGK